MTMLFMDGFEDDAWLYKGTGTTQLVGTTYGRLGGKGMRVGDNYGVGYATRTALVPTGDTIVVGFAMNNVVGNGTEILKSIFTATLNGANLRQNASPDIMTVWVNGSLQLTSDPGFIPLNKWSYVECKVVFHATLGSIELFKNGEPWGTATNLNTGTLPATIKPAWAGGGSADHNAYWLDDIYILDGSGTENNDVLGDSRIEALFPDGNGNSSVMVGSDGNSVDNYLLVDEAIIDEADYVGGATQGDKDTYTMGNLTDNTQTIHCVETLLIAAKSDAGAKYMRPVIRRAATDYVGASKVLATSYEDHSEFWALDPNTSLAWTGANVDGMEVGQEARDS